MEISQVLLGAWTGGSCFEWRNYEKEQVRQCRDNNSSDPKVQQQNEINIHCTRLIAGLLMMNNVIFQTAYVLPLLKLQRITPSLYYLRLAVPAFVLFANMAAVKNKKWESIAYQLNEKTSLICHATVLISSLLLLTVKEHRAMASATIIVGGIGWAERQGYLSIVNSNRSKIACIASASLGRLILGNAFLKIMGGLSLTVLAFGQYGLRVLRRSLINQLITEMKCEHCIDKTKSINEQRNMLYTIYKKFMLMNHTDKNSNSGESLQKVTDLWAQLGKFYDDQPIAVPEDKLKAPYVAPESEEQPPAPPPSGDSGNKVTDVD